QVIVMVAFATLLYSWLLSSKFTNVHTMLLVGVVMGAGLASLTTFMQRMLDPNEFDILTARLMGNISNANTQYLPYAIPIVAAVVCWLIFHSRRLDALSLGSAVSTSLGLDHRRGTIKVLVAVSISYKTFGSWHHLLFVNSNHDTIFNDNRCFFYQFIPLLANTNFDECIDFSFHDFTAVF